MKTNKWLAALVILQGAILLGQWWSSAMGAKPASAQVANPADQRNRQIDEMQSLNRKMDTLIALLQDGKLQVRVVEADAK